MTTFRGFKTCAYISATKDEPVKIASNFQDYYDGVAKKAFDRDTVFVRMRSGDPWPKFESSVGSWDLYGQYGRDAKVESLAVGFCGSFYPLVKVTYDVKSVLGIHLRDRVVLIYDREQAAAKARYRPAVERFFDAAGKQNPDLHDLYGPVFVLHFGNCLVERTPYLHTYGFQSVKPPVEAFTDIYRWVCNRARPLRPIPEMTNDVKIHQAGFDLKTSFRKGKSK